jgi:pyruvate/2-oxoglutarate dehydrogenase complex dihydrolipoamide acyltransferase (E2) component
VSVVTPDGLRVTYLPLAACAVAPGGEVAAGEPIGELAGSGDASLASPHLHLSVHRGEAPIDPATLLLEPVPAGAAVPPPAVGSGVAAPPAAPGAPAPTSRVGVEPRPATAPGPASIAVAPPAVGRALSIEGIRVSDGLGPQTEVRIRPLPYELRFDVRAALTEAREVASAGRGFAARVLLALLAALLFAPIARAASRGATGVSDLAPALARARRVRG